MPASGHVHSMLSAFEMVRLPSRDKKIVSPAAFAPRSALPAPYGHLTIPPL
ncbi:hypothetical protein M1N62_03410 [Thermodesulfovibrionales bacterium]|nr:hypothetical protein [Thermodesulfovibrionales bacterium]MCL0061991.1 hypothetical protein [Thermodesulfovibrionales bacterium]